MFILPRTRFVSAPLLLLSLALCAGITIQHYAQFGTQLLLITCCAATVLSGLASFVFLRARKLTQSTLFLLVAFFFTGVLLTWFGERAPAANRLARLYDEGVLAGGDPVEIVGIVDGEPEPAPQSFYLKLRVERLRFKNSERDASGTVLLLAPKPNEMADQEYEALDLRHGARIRVMTKLDREDDFRNPGGSQFTEYLERKGYDATGTIKSPLLIERLDDAPVFLPLTWIYGWRANLQQEFSQKFSAETAGVLNAALLGNPHNISSAAATRFRAGGTFHLLVISGLQIAFIAGIAFLIVRRMTQNKLLQFLMATLFLWAYTVAVGSEASVARAALMFTVAAFAPVVARRSNSLNAVAGAGLLLLVWHPASLFDPSFQLTFLSVLAIVCLALPVLDRMRRVGAWRPTMATPYPPRCSPAFRNLSESLFWSEGEWRAETATSNIKYRLFKTPLAATFERWHIQRLLRYAFSAVVTSASIQLALLPLAVLYFHRFSFASLVLNIFVGVLMATLGVMALIAVLVSQVSTMIAAPLILIAEQINWLMIHSVDPISRVGIASLRLPHYTGWKAGIYALYFVFLIVAILMFAEWNPLRLTGANGSFSERTVRAVTAALVVTLLLVVFHPFSTVRADGRLRVDFLDVGQGDCAFLTTPEGTTILIDGGGRPSLSWTRASKESGEAAFERDTRSIGERVVSEYLWSRGLDRVDYLIATHADADHIDGLNDIARNFNVRGAIVARAPADDQEFAKFANTLHEVGVPVEMIGAGDVIQVGGVVIEVLWPSPTANPAASSRNNDSMVLRVSLGEKSFLFAADVEKEAEAALLRSGVNLRADVVKVAHHGSKTSSIEQFVAVTRPALAVISVGRQSIFGHPHQEVVDRWHAKGAQVMTTGEKGTISVVTDGRDLKVSTFVP